jgi:hypothetical protein
VPALVVALVLSGGAISQAQIICSIPCPTWDFTAILRTSAINGIKGAINELLQQQAERLYKMAWRLQQFIPLGGHVIHQDNRPEWRIFDYFSGAVIYANPYHRSLSYGDRSGDGFEAISAARPNHVESFDVLRNMTSEAGDEIIKRLALLDAQDSSIVRSTDEVGLIRYGGRTNQAAIDKLQYDITRDDNEESATAVLDKISIARYLHLRDQQRRVQLTNAEVELEFVENMAQREGAAASINRFIRQRRDAGRTANALVGLPVSLTNGGQP